MKKIIHVNRHFIALNTKDGKDRPVYTVKEGGITRYAKEVTINGPCKLVYRQKPLSCGAKAWIETNSDIVLIGETTFQEIKNEY